jgi:hypothetical protein
MKKISLLGKPSKALKAISIVILSIIILPSLFAQNGKTNKNTNTYEIVYQKKFGLTVITMCLFTDLSDNSMVDIGKKIVGNSKFSWVFFYNDKTKIKNINKSTDAIDAMPADGFYAKYSNEYGFQKNENLYITKPTKGPLKIIALENKTKKSIYRWYTYYVENYTDSEASDKAMIKIAKDLPYSNDGFTEVFFFNDKNNAPKLDKDGGWAANESQNSWNAKYGKYCVGYYSIGSGYDGEFSKGWK